MHSNGTDQDQKDASTRAATGLRATGGLNRDQLSNATVPAADLIASDTFIDEDPDTLSAATLAAEGTSSPILASRRISPGETVLVRPVTDQLVAMNIHWLTTGAGYDKQTRMVPCNGKGCVLCITKNEAKQHLFLVLYFLSDAALGVISFARTGGPGSLCSQIVKPLASPSCSDQILEIHRLNKVRYVVKIVKRIDETAEDGIDYGDDVLAEVVASGGIVPADVRATVERMSNEELVAANPQLGTLLAAYGKTNKRDTTHNGANAKK